MRLSNNNPYSLQSMVNHFTYDGFGNKLLTKDQEVTMKQANLNLAQTAILKFINNKDLTTKRTSFSGKWAKYSNALKQWVEGNPKWLQAKDSAYLVYKKDCIFVKWTNKTITIKKLKGSSPRTLEYCEELPTSYGDATMRHS